ncbi:MAG: hypothetical protein LBV23_11720 [Deltaproteobacteria bacterium]|nr:hypothetical protein [Deltaproteobacteria bacterium]
MKKLCPVTFGGELLNPALREQLSLFLNASMESELSAYMVKKGLGKVEGGLPQLMVLQRKDRILNTDVGEVTLKAPFIVNGNDWNNVSEDFQSLICPSTMKTKLSYNHFLSWILVEGLSTGSFYIGRQVLLDMVSPRPSKMVSHRMLNAYEELRRSWLRRYTSRDQWACVWVDMVDFHRSPQREPHRLLVAMGIGRKGEASLLSVQRVGEIDLVQWAKLFGDVMGCGIDKMPPLLGYVDRLCLAGLKKIYRGHQVVLPSQKSMDHLLAQTPKNLRLEAKKMLERYEAANTPEMRIFQLSNFFIRFFSNHHQLIARAFLEG